MKKNYFLMLCSLLLGVTIQAQVSYSGNGNSGFGAPVGGASMTINDDGTTITCTFTKGGGGFNDTMVMYIANGTTGRNVIDGNVNDTNDANRRAISNVGSGDLTLPTGFQATHAVAINTGFGGLWSIGSSGSIGANGLGFIDGVGGPTASTDASFSFSFDWSEIGLTSTDNFEFVIVYGNPNDNSNTQMFSSDEGFGSITAGNPGTSAYSVTTDHSYPNTWTGAAMDNDWENGSNWTEGQPTSTHNVYIPAGLTNYPTISLTTINVNSIKMESGSSLIAENGTLNGTITYVRDLATSNWYLVGSPVAGETIEDLIANNTFATGTAPNIGLAPYDNTQSVATDRWDYQTASSTGSLTSAGGYSVKLNSPGKLIFIGTNQPGTSIPIPDGTGSGGNAFNLVGNPTTSYFPANVNTGVSNLLTQNASELTEQTLWLWNQGTNSYDQINQASAAFYIAPTQGFFVSSSGTGALGASTFSFPSNLQTHRSTDTFQKSATKRPEIKLMLSDGTTNRDTDIYYIDGKTTGFDNGYDSSIFGGVNHEFIVYTEAVANNDGKRLGIQSLPNQDFENTVVPVGIKAAVGKEITFTAEAMNLPEGLKVFLEDRENNTFNELKTTSNYKVTLNTTVNGSGRFFLHTRSSALSTDDISLTGFGIYAVNKNTLRISGVNSSDASVKVYNILGRKVVDQNFSSKSVYDVSLPNLNTGVYIVQLSTEKGKISKKIVLE